MAEWRKEEEKAVESLWQKVDGVEEADKVIIPPGVTAEHFRRCRAALIVPPSRPTKRSRLLQ